MALAGAGLAHRVRNPLAAIRGTAQLMAVDAREAENGRIDRIVAAAERIEAVLGRLLQFARPPETHPETLDLAGLAREVVARAGGSATVAATGGAVVVADREQVESVIEELLANARAFDPQGTLEVSVGCSGGWVELSVADRGSGLDVDSLKAFEPYVTSRPDDLALHRGAAAVAPPQATGGAPPLGRNAREREAIVEALRRAAGNREQAARMLGISVRTLYYRLRTSGLS